MLSLLPDKPELKFGTVFILLCALFYTGLHVAPAAAEMPFNRFFAAASGAALTVAGFPAAVSGPLVSLKNFTVEIIGECSALFILPLLVAFILAYPAAVRQKVTGLLLGILLLAAVNVFRLCLLILVGVYAREQFHFVHVYLGQVIMIFVLAGICLLWLGGLGQGPKRGHAARFILLFFCISLAGFLIWLKLRNPYVFLNFMVIKAVLSQFGTAIELPGRLFLYPHTFFTLNLVLYTGLVLSSNGIRQMKVLALGWGILLGVNLLFVLCQVLFFQLEMKPVFQVINLMLVLSQWLLPFGLWMLFADKSMSMIPNASDA